MALRFGVTTWVPAHPDMAIAAKFGLRNREGLTAQFRAVVDERHHINLQVGEEVRPLRELQPAIFYRRLLLAVLIHHDRVR